MPWFNHRLYLDKMDYTNKGNYYVYSARDEIKKYIVLQQIKTSMYASETQSLYQRGYEKGSHLRAYWSFQMNFLELFRNTEFYLKKADPMEIKSIKEQINNPNSMSPNSLINAYDRYLRLLMQGGLTEIGFEDRPLQEKMLRVT